MKRRFLFMLLAALTCVGANAALLKANNYLKPSDATGTAGKTVEVSVLMYNNVNIINWKTNLVLPNGVTLVKAEAAEKWTEEVKVNGNELFSETETAVAASTQAVVAKLTLQIDASVAAGTYNIAFSGTVMTSDDSKTITQDDNRTGTLTVEEASTKEGDLTGDNEVNAADIQKLLNIIAAGGSADLTGDGETNAADIQKLLNIIASNN
ncbi:MAG: hypothetical protein J5524_01115 [Bacteroidaceae bacterium]|nr:hypothetical protein [Bacteroidaceae bacterium]